MLLWVLMVIGWALVMVLAISLFRLAGYADRKMRARSLRAMRAMRARRRQDQVA